MWYKDTQGKISMARVTNTHLVILISMLVIFITISGISNNTQNKEFELVKQDLRDIKKLIKVAK
jgi:hypothetical protein